MLRWGRTGLLFASFCAALAALGQASAQDFEGVWIPMQTSSFVFGEKTIRLEATLYRPKGDGPFPIVIVSHGSTGGKIPPTQTLRPSSTAPLLLERGFVVLAPMRRGRGASDGSYNEPYGCDLGGANRGLENALEDLEAAVAFVRTLPYVDSSRLVLMGASRGGLLSLAYAARRPAAVRAVINFVGGWHGDGCPADFNASVYEKAGAASKVPTLWLYAENDRMYSASSIKRYASIYERAGGQIIFRLYPPAGPDGHYLTRYPELWRKDIGAFLDGLGFTPR